MIVKYFFYKQQADPCTRKSEDETTFDGGSFSPTPAVSDLITRTPPVTPIKHGANTTTSRHYSGLKCTRSSISPLVKEANLTSVLAYGHDSAACQQDLSSLIPTATNGNNGYI